MEKLFENNKDKVSKAIFAFIIIISLFFVVKAVNELKSSSYIGREGGMQSTISVEGKGEVFQMPDIATFSFTVSQRSQTVKKAQDTVTEKMNKILGALKKMGIEGKDITTGSYNLYPEYEYQQITCFAYPCPESKKILLGYTVNHNVSIKIRDLDKVGSVLNELGGLGATDVSGVSFSIDKEDEVKAEARDLAIENAKEKAEDLADKLGVNLVRVISYYEYGSPVYANVSRAKSEGYGMGGSSPVPEIPTGESKLVSTVNITYEIR